MIVTKFHENRLIIDGEINEKHAPLVECGPGTRLYSKSHFKSVTFALHVFRSLLEQFSSDFHEI